MIFPHWCRDFVGQKPISTHCTATKTDLVSRCSFCGEHRVIPLWIAHSIACLAHNPKRPLILKQEKTSSFYDVPSSAVAWKSQINLRSGSQRTKPNLHIYCPGLALFWTWNTGVMWQSSGKSAMSSLAFFVLCEPSNYFSHLSCALHFRW